MDQQSIVPLASMDTYLERRALAAMPTAPHLAPPAVKPTPALIRQACPPRSPYPLWVVIRKIARRRRARIARPVITGRITSRPGTTVHRPFGPSSPTAMRLHCIPRRGRSLGPDTLQSNAEANAPLAHPPKSKARPTKRPIAGFATCDVITAIVRSLIAVTGTIVAPLPSRDISR